MTPPDVRQVDRLRCAVCGALLIEGYYYLHGQQERYCGGCMRDAPRCASCGRPLGEQRWTLHDGRLQCARCHSTAVYDAAAARQLFDETVGAVVAQLGLTLRVGVAFRLVDLPTLSGLQRPSGPADQEQRPMGLYVRDGHTRAIYVLYALPKIMFRTVVAHEYAHAWQSENCPIMEPKSVVEGFAEWVAYRHLQTIGAVKIAEQLRGPGQPYQAYLEQMLTIEMRDGQRAVIDTMLRAGRGTL